jgi:RNA 2',3'-cyclic 3'-phosphodiesterase
VRCFVACWPDDATRAQLDQVARDAHSRHPGARRIRGDNLHLTLAFIGELSSPKGHEAARVLRDVSIEPFEWRIDHVGRFDRARVLWAGGQPEPRLEQLAESVRSQLKTLQIRFDEKRFAAHVTLLRDLPPLPARSGGEALYEIEPLVWPIRGALMIVSERDPKGATVYRPLASD